jgi:hypothetical protein
MSQSQPQPPEADRPSAEDTPVVPSTPVEPIIQPVAEAATTQPNLKPAPASNKLTAFFRLVRQLVDIIVTTLPLIFTLLGRFVQLVLTGLKAIQAAWDAILPKLRTSLPEPWKTKVPNQLITALALLFLLVLISLTSNLLPGKSPAIAQTPGEPSALPVEPKPAVNPEKLLKIQDQVAEIAEPYAPGLIESVQVNPRRSRLKIALGQDWYALEPGQQDKLANEVLKRSHKLKFDRLELTNTEGTLLARSPVVGSTMLILERIPSPSSPETPL